MLYLLPILLTLIGPVIMVLIRLVRPRFAYFWLTAALSALFALLFVLLAQNQLPLRIDLAGWQPQELLHSSPVLIFDSVSWSFALALSTLMLANILTAIARPSDANWQAWAGGLAITAFGLLAVLAGNLVTLLMTWAAIDVLDLVISLKHILESRTRGRIALAFAARAAGILLLMWAWIEIPPEQSTMTLTAIPENISIYLLLAASLRLGVLPPQMPFSGEIPKRRGLSTLLSLVTAAASLMLLARVAVNGAPANLRAILLALTTLSSLYAGIAWLNAGSELEGRPFWILGGACLAFAAAVRGQPAASLAWSLATLLSGGLLFLVSAYHRLLLPLLVVGMLGFTSLPFTPAWQGVRLFSAPYSIWLVFLLLGHALLLAGYLRHSLRAGSPLQGVERWVWIIYPWGLLLLPVAHNWITWWGHSSVEFPQILSSWPAFLSAVLVGILYAADRRGYVLPARWLSSAQNFLSFDWLYRALWGLYHSFGRAVRFINLILEGEGGILWTLLLLTLMISLLTQLGLGE
ncbi:MAG: hypothetical protein P8074_06670 [Anaerolineales bacterium]